jgi:hypothetical protein
VWRALPRALLSAQILRQMPVALEIKSRFDTVDPPAPARVSGEIDSGKYCNHLSDPVEQQQDSGTGGSGCTTYSWH